MYKHIDNFFSKDECNTAIDEVTHNQPLWYRCNETGMYILGNSFLRNRLNNYQDKNVYNFYTTLLFKEKLLTIFSKVELAQRLAKPGFQIIKRNETREPAVWHYDNAMHCFPYEIEFAEYRKNFNDFFEKSYVFTLMLSDGIASFDYHPKTKSKFCDNGDQTPSRPICESHADLVGDNCANKDCQLTEFQTVNYKQGSLLIQDERYLHRVGYKDINGTATNRITLNGYGVVKNEIMYLFW